MTETRVRAMTRVLMRCILIPWEVPCALYVSLISLAFYGRMPYRDYILWGGIFAIAAWGTWQKRAVSSMKTDLKAIPRWWRWLWRGVIIANIAVYFVWANLR